MKERIGLIDIGSNTIRLVVFQIEDNLALREIQNIKIPARIFQYLDDDKVMSPAGIDVLCEILESFANEAAILKVDRLLPRATAAIRLSKNCDDIISEVRERSGVTIDLVTGEQEAFYGFNAVIHSMIDREAITVDIGGGSTEVTIFKNKELKQSHSFPFGAVTLQEMFFAGTDHNDPAAIEKAQAFIHDQFEAMAFIKNAGLPIVAIGGSARNVARVHQMRLEYPIAGLHHYKMLPADVDDILTLFVQSSLAELEKLEGLSSDRADIIIPATLVFTELINVVHAPLFKFSQRGLREGIIYEYVAANYPRAYDIDNVAMQSVERLTDLYGFNMADSAQRMVIARQLYSALHESGYVKFSQKEEKLLDFSAYLYSVGSMIETGSASQHTFYMLANTNLNGFDHKERVGLALMASYKNKTLLKQYLKPFGKWFSDDEQNKIQIIGSLIKFAEALNDSHYNIVRNMDIVMKNKQIILRIFYHGHLISEKYRAESQKKHIERVIGNDVKIEFINAKAYDQIM